MGERRRANWVLAALEQALHIRKTHQRYSPLRPGQPVHQHCLGKPLQGEGVRPSAGRWATPMTTPWLRVSLPAWSANWINRRSLEDPGPGTHSPVLPGIEGWYNLRRRHCPSTTLSPMNFGKETQPSNNRHSQHGLPTAASRSSQATHAAVDNPCACVIIRLRIKPSVRGVIHLTVPNGKPAMLATSRRNDHSRRKSRIWP